MHAIPVDSRIRTKGIQLASLCKCCTMGNEESLTHLFLHSEIARLVWKCFRDIFRLPWQFVSVAHAVENWIPKSNQLSQFDQCKAHTMAWIFREIWVARCNSVFEDVPMNARTNYLSSTT